VRRLALVFVGLLAGFLLLEAALQLAAAVLVARQPTRRHVWNTDGRRMLVVGDSNTYGLWVEPEQAYPAVFEKGWNLLADPDERVDVDVFARPGMNSAQAVELVDAALGAHRPDVLVLMIGANDFWSASGADLRWWEHSRVVRLLDMLWTYATRGILVPLDLPERVDVGGRDIELEFVGSGSVRPDQHRTTLGNLRTIVTTARAAGTDVVLLTYPADDDVYGNMNQVIRRFARDLNVSLLDVGRELRRRCRDMRRDGACQGPNCGPPVLPFAGTHSRCGFLFPDGHPTAAGHAVAAQKLIDGYHRIRAEARAAIGNPPRQGP